MQNSIIFFAIELMKFINSIAKKFWRFLTKKLRLENGARFLVFSYFRGCFGQVLFPPFFAYGFQNGAHENGAKECIV